METPASHLQRSQSRSRRRHRVSQTRPRRPGRFSPAVSLQTISIGTAVVDIPAVPAASALPQTEFPAIDELPLIELVADVPTRKRGKPSSRNASKKRTKRVGGRKPAQGKRRKRQRKTFDDASEIGSFSDVGSWEVISLSLFPPVPKTRGGSLHPDRHRLHAAASLCAIVARNSVAITKDPAEPVAAAGITSG